MREKYRGRVVRTGKRGGKYIILNGKKKYLSPKATKTTKTTKAKSRSKNKFGGLFDYFKKGNYEEVDLTKSEGIENQPELSAEELKKFKDSVRGAVRTRLTKYRSDLASFIQPDLRTTNQNPMVIHMGDGGGENSLLESNLDKKFRSKCHRDNTETKMKYHCTKNQTRFTLSALEFLKQEEPKLYESFIKDYAKEMRRANPVPTGKEKLLDDFVVVGGTKGEIKNLKNESERIHTRLDELKFGKKHSS